MTGSARGARRRGRPSRHDNPQAAVLTVAAEVLNEDGLTNASLETVAERLGIAKSAIYYYFQNKEELVYKCYVEACLRGKARVEAADAAGGTGRDRLLRYLRLQLDDANPPAAIVSELSFLKSAHRAEIRKLAREHDSLLRGILERGLADRSLALGDPALVNFAIIGALNWTTVWGRRGPGYLSPSQIAELFIDIFMYGFKPAGAALAYWPAPVAAERPFDRQTNAFERSWQALQKREALFRAASAFFNLNGYDGASLDDIVDSLGVTRGAFYHYVDSKEELLYGCYSRSLDLTAQVLALIEKQEGSGIDRIIRYIISMIELHTGPHGPMANYVRLKSLTPEHQREVHQRSRSLQETVAGFFERGMRDGSVRPLDVRMSRLALQGAINWLPRWYSPTGRCSPSEMAAVFAGLFVNGLAPRP